MQMGTDAVHVVLDPTSTGLAYLWNESPVLGTLALPIYAKDSYKLPAGPWQANVVFSQ